MTHIQANFSDQTPHNPTDEPATRRPYLRGAFVAIPVVFYALCKLSNQRVALFELLVRWANPLGQVTTPQVLIAQKLGCQPNSLARHLQALADEGLITFEPGTGTIELRPLKPTMLIELRKRGDLKLLANEDQLAHEGAVSLICEAITDDQRLCGSDRRVYGAYAARASKTDGTTFISDARMAADLDLNPDTIKRSRRHLEKLGHIKVHTGNRGRQIITLLPPEPPQRDETPLRTAPSTPPNCTPQPLQTAPHNQREKNQTTEPESNARAHGARNLSELDADEGFPNQPVESKEDLLLDEDTHQVLELTRKVLDHTPDPEPELVPQLIRHRLRRGQTVALLTAALLTYGKYARYHLPASVFMRSVVDKWACPTARRPAQLSGRQRHAIESERRFKANLLVGAHEPRPQPTPEEVELRRRRFEAWRALPLTLPVCERLEDQQRHHAAQLLKLVRRAEPTAFLDFFASSVWGGDISFEVALEEATDWLMRRPGGLEPHQTHEAFDQALRRGRRDVRLEEVDPSNLG